jgi:hypothetical protein
MSKSSQQLKDEAKEIIGDVHNFVDVIERTNNSFFSFVRKYQIDYIITTIRSLCSLVLSLSTTAAAYERTIGLQEQDIEALQRINLALSLENEKLKANREV